MRLDKAVWDRKQTVSRITLLDFSHVDEVFYAKTLQVISKRFDLRVQKANLLKRFVPRHDFPGFRPLGEGFAIKRWFNANNHTQGEAPRSGIVSPGSKAIIFTLSCVQ